MPAHAKRPSPPARMVELLAVEKRRVIAAKGFVAEEDFNSAWELCWATMVTERAWPHATEHRRTWRKAMREAMMPEARACFLDAPSGFSKYVLALASAMDGTQHARDEMLTGQLVA